MELRGNTHDISRKQREIEFHRGIATEEGEAWGWSTPAGRKRVERRLKIMRETLRLQPGMKILEIGCGLGFFSREIAQTGVQLTSIDLSEELLAGARRSISGVEFLRQDAEYLSFSEASFDGVVGISVLHHVHLERTLQGIYKVMKPGAGFFFTEPNMMNPQIFLERNVPWIRKMAKNSPDETAFFRGPLQRKLQASGLMDVKVEPFDFLHPWTAPRAIEMIEKIGNWVEQMPGLREIAGSLVLTARKPDIPG